MMNSATKLPLHHAFVDFENVQDCLVDHIGHASVHITILLGVHQQKLDVALVEFLLANAAAVKLVRLTSAGKNALDFLLAYHIGRAVETNPNAQFHIISKDTGYDPLVKHLVSQNIRIQRHNQLSSQTFGAALPAKAVSKPQPGKQAPGSVDDEWWYVKAITQLTVLQTSRPKTHKALAHYLKEFCENYFTPSEISELIHRLCTDNVIKIGTGGKVTYIERATEDLEVHEDDIPF